ncbi:MAG: SUMF1/EgtB/PvdO family nonheme iron enzyme [Candidatus Kapabacteria bacterium]|nr:SUMF1/EgtB/PvdO family nonheme iron enzyme [Candidatus Kapabacteria bacterium]
MIQYKIVFLVCFYGIASCQAAFAGNLKISNVELTYNSATTRDIICTFTIRWENAWFNEKNNDAAWVFVKALHPERQPRHLRLAEKGHRIVMNHRKDASNPAITIAPDKTGLFIAPTAKHRGDIDCTVQVVLDSSTTSVRGFATYEVTLAVYGIEMVRVPEGAFTLGDPDTTALGFGALYRSAGNGVFGGLVKIQSETQIMDIGKDSNQLWYRADQPAYQGDQRGPLPTEFPKGYKAFYVMKYELTQGQYADFLQSLSPNQSQLRANMGGRGYYQNRGTIKLQNNRYIATSPERPCNYLSWDDACAFADWAALRPMTELEYTKACRGTSDPLPHEYPWGTSTKDNLSRRVSPETDELVLSNGFNESQLHDKNRDVFGASFYWVMDLAGSLWERVITIGHPRGRNFKGTHGDGALTDYGNATNEDWPQGNAETGGFGFRGGGYYEHFRINGEFLPFSPIAYRRFGAWSGGNRSIAYGSRFVRTAQ